ncbi:MAG: D-glycero-beta-D-manno-heptose 1-phosphate adenylyltransferase [Paludisphaera borealis]|uniref:D-glycero-beta-D-manno-heptose 1-phosphate adenylyltransferase n=1 Tax=Paludisphaera borealis TaxID=1387353 RepID=UPI0028482A70|nr:D-glycero-beta-D-manno-heptose 1-phosphate adenylyltransferase [Paludisphaera borealis]MDR3622640.1 D-glycero-beta-D-manno-heptose 1-phosphate adenylyltransferase [Paludisphaera borealis]
MFQNPVLVVGDVMLDRHVHGQVRRISPEAPVPVVSLLGEVQTPGGAGNVAAGLAGLGCRVTLAGLIGADAEGAQLRQVLASKGVERLAFVEHPDLTTVTKTRILSDTHQQLLRLDRDGDRGRFAALDQLLLDHVLPLIDDQSAVVLADYEKGVITPRVAREIIGRCRRRGVPCVVDPKKADFSVYAEATVVTPNLMEAERAIGRALPDDETVGRAADQLRDRLRTDAMLITRGPEGMTLSAAGDVHHVPSQTRDVADVTGAGDTVVAVLAACLGSGRPILESCRIANAAAGIAVSHPGTYVVQAAELEAAWQGLSPKILNRNAAQRRLAEARRRGRKVVFTNGCFDLLHAGHLACLEGAKRLGDLLVVGLNSDSSVQGLKGDARPVIGQSNRASLLAGLACVDVVVVFDEETPVSLIELFEPDVLVKGGDYTVDQIAGADVVLRRGGQVVALPLVPGLSTTAILDRKARA